MNEWAIWIVIILMLITCIGVIIFIAIDSSSNSKRT